MHCNRSCNEILFKARWSKAKSKHLISIDISAWVSSNRFSGIHTITAMDAMSRREERVAALFSVIEPRSHVDITRYWEITKLFVTNEDFCLRRDFAC